MRILIILLLSFLTTKSFRFVDRDILFHKIKNEHWSLKNSETFIRNSMSASQYISLDKKGCFRYRIDRCGPCGLSEGSYKRSGDTITLNWDKEQSLSFSKTFKGPPNFRYIAEEIKNFKLKKLADTLVFISEELDDN